LSLKIKLKIKKEKEKKPIKACISKVTDKSNQVKPNLDWKSTYLCGDKLTIGLESYFLRWAAFNVELWDDYIFCSKLGTHFVFYSFL